MPPKKNQCGGGILDRFKKKSEAAKKIDALKEKVRKDRGFDKTKEERDARKNMTKGKLEKQLKEKAMKEQQKIKDEADELVRYMIDLVNLERILDEREKQRFKELVKRYNKLRYGISKTPTSKELEIKFNELRKGGGKKKKTKTTKTKKRKSQKSILSIFS